MPLSDDDIAELERRAHAAFWDGYTWRPAARLVSRADTDVAWFQHAEDAAFVEKADPPAVLELIARVRAAETAVEFNATASSSLAMATAHSVEEARKLALETQARLKRVEDLLERWEEKAARIEKISYTRWIQIIGSVRELQEALDPGEKVFDDEST